VSLFDRDPFVGRVERTALAACLAAAAAALAVRGGRPDVAIGVLGGGLLSAASYWAIRSAVDLLLRAAAGAAGGARPGQPGGRAGRTGEARARAGPEGRCSPEGGAALAGPGEEGEKVRARRRRAAAGALARLSGRYALLAFLAYVMIARFRLHPIGLLIGVSSLPFAASVEAVRAVRGPGRPPSR
jgi:hypothetical protein